jgi:hypothetical protein
MGRLRWVILVGAPHIPLLAVALIGGEAREVNLMVPPYVVKAPRQKHELASSLPLRAAARGLLPSPGTIQCPSVLGDIARWRRILGASQGGLAAVASWRRLSDHRRQ